MNADAIPPFLHRLDLSLDADARAIKRAYARELKRIDQEIDLIGFQELRECYEVALRWAAWDLERREQEAKASEPDPTPAQAGAPEPIPARSPRSDMQAAQPADDGLEALDIVLPPSTKVIVEACPAPLDMLASALPAEPGGEAHEPGIDPEQLSLNVYHRFTNACKVLGNGRFLEDVQLWETELLRRLNDDELINLEARTIFEARVAHLIAGEWQAINAPLFRAASKVFEWDGDRRRLQQFGYAGAFLYQATEEARMFDAQPEPDQQSQRRLLARLRQNDADTARATMVEQKWIERMIERFPSLLTLHARHELIEQWRKQGKRPRPSVARVPVVDTSPEPVLYGDTSKRRGFDKAWILFAVIAIVSLLRAWQVHGTSFSSTTYTGGQFIPPTASQQSDAEQTPYVVPASRRVDPGSRPVRAKAKLDQSVIDAIGNDIEYKFAKNAAPGRRLVKFEVFLDPDGRVLGMNKLAKSIDPDWDKAVEAAIRRAPPFPDEAGTTFVIEYGTTLTYKAPRPAPKKSIDQAGQTEKAEPSETIEAPPEETGEQP